MQHVLARHAALEAARTKITAHATLTATACGMGVKDAHHDYNALLAQMDAIIKAAGPEPETVGTDELEIAAFDKLERTFTR